jgi:hypothetical protein
MRKSGWAVLILIITVVASVGALLVGRKQRSVRRSPALAAAAVAAPRALSPLPTRPLTPRLARVRERLMQTAAETRGLDWQTAPGMIELTGWEYGTRTKEMADALGGDELRSLSRLAAAGGLLPEGTDLATLAASFAAASAGASYSPLDKQVLLLADPHGKRPTSDSLLAHELVHALQDQHFDLLSMLLTRPYNFDREEALFSVVEGDAMDVQRRLEQGDAWTRRPLDDVARMEDERFDEYRRDIGVLFPPLLTETFIFRYRDGVCFVEAARRKGGAHGVDELFRRPPVSSAQVLHPEKYFANEQPRAVSVNEQAFAAQGWTVGAATPLGEIGVRGLLLSVLSAQDAARAAAGWSGDRAYLFERANATPLFVWRTAWDNTADAEEFFRAYSTLGQRAGEAFTRSDAAQTTWRAAGRTTFVRRERDQVVIIRGTEAEARAALELVRD